MHDRPRGRRAFSLGRVMRRGVLLACAALVACNDDPAPPDETPEPTVFPQAQPRGALNVTIVGLPAGGAGDVAISGPVGFSRTMTASGVITGIKPGTYTVIAAPVAVGPVEFTPAQSSEIVSVTGGATRNVFVSYAGPGEFALRAQEVVAGLTSPVYVTAPPGDTRLFIIEQPGRVRIYKDGALLPASFLDITGPVLDGGERGLLSMAFDPGYSVNGRFYVYYTDINGDIVVDRFTVSANPDIANTTAERVIAVQHRMAGNHNGGMVTFGPDGMLYLAPGDGGGGGDPQDNGQNINSLLGKLLRIDVSSLPYTNPPDNPFVNQDGADEIWASGLRNPWRFSFDGTGASAQLYIADVGQNLWEEVNALSATTPGVNYGWRIMEGTHCYNPGSGCNQTGLTMPVHEYSHAGTCSVTGGFVYRGTEMPEIAGLYFYSDYCAGWLRSFRLSGGLATEHRDWQIGSVGNVTSFGVDGFGELYMTSGNGRVYRIVRTTVQPAAGARRR